MPIITADIVQYRGTIGPMKDEHIGIRYNIADTFEELKKVLSLHLQGLRESTGLDWTIDTATRYETALQTTGFG